MGTTPNPIYAGLIPGGNPTGSGISTGAPQASTAQSYSPSMIPTGGTSPIANPFNVSANTSTGAAPTFSANGAGSASPIIPGSSSSSTGISGAGPSVGTPNNTAVQNNLNSLYGKGIGSLIGQFLQSGAGYNPQALQSIIAQLQPQFAQQQSDLTQQFSAGGNRFSSGAQVGQADLMSQQNLDVSNIATQLYEQSIQNYMNVMMGVGSNAFTNKENSPSIWDTIGSALGLTSEGAGALSQGGVGGSLTSILSNL